MPIHGGARSSNATKGVSGTNESTAKKQFKINPKLQRTQVTGNQQGLTKTTTAINVEAEGIIRLPNRSVPLNPNQKPKRRAGRQPR